MKGTVRILGFIALVGLLLGLAVVGANDAVAADGVTVSINAPAQVVKGDTFTATVDITNVAAFDAGQFDVSFNQSLIQLDSVTAGLVGTTQIPIALWNKTSAGTYRIIVNVTGIPGINGSGYLAVLNLHAASSAVGNSAVSLSNGFLNNTSSSEITATWVGDSVSVCEPPAITTTSLSDTVAGTAYSVTLGATGGNGNYTWSVLSGSLPGGLTLTASGTISGTSTAIGNFTFTVQVTDGQLSDSQSLSIKVTDGQLSDSQSLSIKVTSRPSDTNGDGVIDAADITTLERIIVGLESTTPGADPNQDGKINTADITTVEAIIVGMR